MTTQPVEKDEYDDDTHPAFGVAIVSRPQNNYGASLFQSNVKHHQTITIQICEATRKRDINQDWVHAGPLITEIEVSLAQWGALISGIGDGGGVPVTIRYRDGERVPAIPFESRLAKSLNEATTSVDKLMAPIKEALDELDEAEDNKAGVKTRRELREKLRHAVTNAARHADFTVDQLNRQAEHTVAQVRSDIEAMIMEASTRSGFQLGSGKTPPIELTDGDKGD